MVGLVSVSTSQVATVDLVARTLTVRECLWNADPAHRAGPLVWGASTTVAFAPRPVLIKPSADADAHELYAKYGFTPLGAPDNFMELHRLDVYRAPVA